MTQNSKFLFVFLVLSLFISCAQAPQQLISEKPAAPVVDLTSEKIRDSIVLIKSENASGTGFFVAPDKIATNIHVVAHAGPVFVKTLDRKKNRTVEGVVAFDTENKLVILKLTSEGTPLPLGNSNTLEIGESISILDYPNGEYKVTDTSIQSIRDSNKWLRVNTTTSKGPNGSPVFNNKGQVIAVIVPYNVVGSYSYAMPSSALEALLDKSMPVEPLTEWQKRKQIRAEAAYSLGAEKFKVKNYAGAIIDFDKAIELNPEYVRAYYERGRAQARLGDNTSAIASCTQAIKIDPSEADAYYGRGTVRALLGKYTAAIVDLNKAIELDAQYADAYTNRGGVKFKLGESEGERGNAKEAQRLYEEAIADCDKAIEIDPEHAGAYKFRGGTKLAFDDLEGAILDFGRAIEIDPKNADVYNNRGWAKSKFGESENARGNAKEAQRLYEAAIEDYTRTIEIDSEHTHAYNNRGVVESKLGESASDRGDVEKAQMLYKAAIEDYTQSLQNNPEDTDAYNKRGILKCKLGDIESARGDVEKAQTLYREGIIDYGKSIQISSPKDVDAKVTDLASEHTRNSTVRVMSWSGGFHSGSGFFVDKNKIVTNFHVIAELIPVFAMITDKEEVWAVEGVTAYDAKNDLVILKIAGEGVLLPLDNSDAVKIGDPVTAVGYPGGKYKTVSKGTVHSIRSSDKWFKVKVELAPGNSGSPVINSSGQVIGIVSSMADPSKVTDPYGHAIPSNVLRTLLTGSMPIESLGHWYKRDRIRAYAKYAFDQYKEAIADFDKIIKRHPENADAYTDRAWLKLKFAEFEAGHAKKAQRLYQASIEDYTQAIRINPKFVDAYNSRGVVKLRLDDFEGAIFDFSKAIQVNPKDTDAYSNRAGVRFQLGAAEFRSGNTEKAQELYKAAIEDYTQVVKLNPENTEAYRDLGAVKSALSAMLGR